MVSGIMVVMSGSDGLPLEAIAEICRKHRVRSLAVFGSFLTSGFDPGRSDIDFLVDFSEETTYTLLSGTQDDLSELLGRNVDLVSAEALASCRYPKIRSEIYDTCEVIYSGF